MFVLEKITELIGGIIAANTIREEFYAQAMKILLTK